MKSHTAIPIAALGVSVASLTELHAQDPAVQRRQLRAPEIIAGHALFAGTWITLDRAR